MVPFSQFIAIHNLSALVDILFPSLFIGGLGSWENLMAYFALRNLAPTITSQEPQANFAMEGGCQTIYDGMVKYLGANNVWTLTTTTSVTRPKKNSNGKVELKGTTKNGTQDFEVTCKKLVIGFPQNPTNLASIGIELDPEEVAQFSSITARVYSDGTITVEGPINSTNNANFSLSRINIADPFKHVSQGFFLINNQVPWAPSNIYGFSNVPISSADYKSLIQIHLNLVPKSLITNYTIHEVNTHGFYPAPSVAALTDPVGYYTKLQRLQGRRSTYWVGCVHGGFAAHHSIIDKAKRLVDEFF